MKRSALSRNQRLRRGSPLASGAGPKRTGKKPSQPRRDWSAARAKVEAEGRCRACGFGAAPLEAAHVIGRALDRRDGYRVLPSRVVPLDPVCHRRYDALELDLWLHLSLAEQAQAIEDAGGFWLAVKRCAPLAYRTVVGS